MSRLTLGLMAGTSADGIDAALVDCSSTPPKVIGTYLRQYPPELRSRILNTAHADYVNLDDFFQLDQLIAEELSTAAIELLSQEKCSAKKVIAIGSHGQTVRHRPNPPQHFTVQLGNPNIIVARTGIDVVTDFRRADMAMGGQGAPLAPLFHDKLLREKRRNIVVLNLGGIANITVLSDDFPTLGFDTGPANSLMDLWISQKKDLSYDKSGIWAASGTVNEALLASMLSDAYFKQPPPKSTGREYFSEKWLARHLLATDLPDNDVQATLCELTATTIAHAIKKACSSVDQIIFCGGGHKNEELLRRLQVHFPKTVIESRFNKGIDPDFLEAILFAWLAHRHLQRLPGSMPSITGCAMPLISGCLYPSTNKNVLSEFI